MKIELELTEEFTIIEEGTCYSVPIYDVVDGKGLQKVEDTGEKNDPFQNQIINFVLGSKLGEEEVPKRRGTTHEHLVSVMIYDLKFKNGLVPSKETALIITALESALNLMRARQIERIKRGVQGTYKE